MKLNDKQLGIPSTMFTGTTAEIAALSAVEGMIAYDTDLDNGNFVAGSTFDLYGIA